MDTSFIAMGRELVIIVVPILLFFMVTIVQVQITLLSKKVEKLTKLVEQQKRDK